MHVDTLSEPLYERRELPIDAPLHTFVGVTDRHTKVIPAHFHSVLELVWFYDGKGGTITVNGQRYPYHPGEAIIIHPYAMQSYELHSCAQRHALFFLDTASFLALFEHSLLEASMQAFIDRLCALPVVNSAITREMIECLAAADTQNTTAVISAVCALDAACSGVSAPAREGVRFAKALSYLEMNYHRKIGLTEAAEYASMSKYYFSREFKKVMGEGFVEFLNRIRLKKAESLLRFSDESIADIAASVGFSSVSYFNNVFKRYHSMNPNHFRKRKTAQ
ncbi:MAG TPA: AraC family transcriptional regulator [Armatimonadota bacterium]|jgi:AraC-like DNA-binding protein